MNENTITSEGDSSSSILERNIDRIDNRHQSNPSNLEYRLANYRAKAEVMEKEILMNGSQIDGTMFWYISVNALFMYNSTILRAYCAYILHWIITALIIYGSFIGASWLLDSMIIPFIKSFIG